MKERNGVGRQRTLARSLAVVAVVAVPLVVVSLPDYWVQLCITAAIDAIVLQSLGILVDRTKLFVLCPLSFAGIGAWVTLQVFVWNWPGNLFLWIVFAGVATIPFGLLMGIPALRLRGLYLAVITLSFAFVLDSVFAVVPFPGSESLKYFTRPSLLTGDGSYFVFCWIIFVVFAVVLYLFDQHPFGVSWRCIARSERATAAMGFSVRKAKLSVFIISAFIAGVSGALLVGQVFTAVEANFAPVTSLELFAVALLFGTGLAEGAAVGGLFTAFTPQILRSINVPQDFGNILFPIGAIQVLSAGMSASGAWRATLRRIVRRRRAGRTVEDASRGPVVGQETGGLGVRATAVERTVASEFEQETGPALSVKGLTVRFGSVVALDGLDLTVPRGTVSGLIGPNGAGKSSLVDAISGFIGHYSGSIEVEGSSIDSFPVHRRIQAGIRRTFQQERTIPELTAEQYVQVAAHRRISTSEIAEILEFVGGPNPHERIANVDVGARRLVEIAGCLAARPKALLLDEPTAGLAEAESLTLAARIAQLPDLYGCAVLLIEHDMEVVRAACSHITVVDFGKKIAEGTPEEALQLNVVVAAYLGGPDDTMAAR